MNRCVIGFLLIITCVAGSAMIHRAVSEETRPDSSKKMVASGKEESKESFRTETIRGRVVWMADAVERRLGVKSVPEAADRVLAIETTDGKLLPILEDVRGRAFRVDKRLRNLDLELLVRRYEA